MKLDMAVNFVVKKKTNKATTLEIVRMTFQIADIFYIDI